MNISSPAGKRITSLLDENSFVEIGGSVTSRSTDFAPEQTDSPSDGVITGYGLIDGRLVYVYSQDGTVLNGSIGEMHAAKIAKLYDMAIRMGAPIVAMLDSAGLRLKEASDGLYGLGAIYKKEAEASGVIPQIAGVFGECGGGLAIAASLCDFTFMEKGGRLFVNAPNAIVGNTKEKCDTSGWEFRGEESGDIDMAGDENEVIAGIRSLVSMLPSNCEDDDAYSECVDNLNRAVNDIEAAIKDPAVALSKISDNGVFFETRRCYAREMVTGFIKLNGITVGVTANRTAVYDENGKEKESYGSVLTRRGCEKAGSFVNFCDSFGIPLLSVTNVDGFESTMIAEKGIQRSAARMVAAYSSADVPKINLIAGKAIGSASLIMNSQAIGSDITIAWPTAKMGTMDAKLAAKILMDGKGSEEIDKCAAEYDKLQNGIETAAKRGYVDEIIEPKDTRKYIIGALEMLMSKSEGSLIRKHRSR